MTRVNTGIKPKELPDKLLIAEIGEIPRILYNVDRILLENKPIGNIPKTFSLGTGHMRFFYNKCYYIYTRYLFLRREFYLRTGKVYSKEHFLEQKRRYSFIRSVNPDLCKDYTPTKKDKDIVSGRITSNGFKLLI